jgi:hypothetical protein
VTAEYAMSWMVKRYGDELGTWPLGMVKKCSEMMAAYGDDQVDFSMKQLVKKQEEEEKYKQLQRSMKTTRDERLPNED